MLNLGNPMDGKMNMDDMAAFSDGWQNLYNTSKLQDITIGQWLVY